MRVILIFVIAITMGYCGSPDPKVGYTWDYSDKKADIQISDDDYAIYSCVINSLNNLDQQQLLISNQTTFGDVKPKSTLEDVGSAIRGLRSKIVDESVVKDYLQKNQTISYLEARFVLGRIYAMSDLPSGESPSRPIVKITFSRVGIDSKHEKAIVYFERYSSMNSAAGFFVTVVKREGSWKVTESFNIWAT